MHIHTHAHVRPCVKVRGLLVGSVFFPSCEDQGSNSGHQALKQSAFAYWVSILLALKTYLLYINISTVCVSACTNLGTPHASLVPAEARKGWWILWNQSYRQLWAIMWMLGYSEHVSPGNADLGTCREWMFNYSLIQASIQFIVPYMFHKCVMILFHVDNGI